MNLSEKYLSNTFSLIHNEIIESQSAQEKFEQDKIEK